MTAPNRQSFTTIFGFTACFPGPTERYNHAMRASEVLFRLGMGLLVVIFPVACRAANPATQPGDSPAPSLQALKDSNRKIIDTWQNYDALPDQSIDDVAHFEFADNRLTVNSAFQYNPVSHVFKIKGFPGQAMVRSTAPLRRRFASSYFMMEYYDFSRPDLIDEHWQILSSTNSLQIAQDLEFPGQTRTLSLTQSTQNRDDAVNFSVQAISETDGKVYMNISFTAPSIDQLCRDHPEEAERYLRPLFQDLHQQWVIFGLSDRAVWQAVADSWTPDPHTIAVVNELLGEFNSEDFDTRENASANLRVLGQPAALYLMSIDRTGYSPEQKARVNAFLKSYQVYSDARIREQRKNIDFLLDCLNTDDDDLRARALDHLNRVLPHPIKFDLAQSPELRSAAIDRLREELSPIRDRWGPTPATQPSAK
jgi:hypothetical protein